MNKQVEDHEVIDDRELSWSFHNLEHYVFELVKLPPLADLF